MLGLAASGKDDFAGKSEEVRASLYFQRWILRKHQLHFWNKSKHQHLQERVCEMTELDFSDLFDFRAA